MSQNSIQARIRSNPKFAEMVGKRTRFAILLSLDRAGAVLHLHDARLACSRRFLRSQISEGSVITIGWPIAALIVVGGWLLTGIYVSRANGEFDRSPRKSSRRRNK